MKEKTFILKRKWRCTLLSVFTYLFLNLVVHFLISNVNEDEMKRLRLLVLAATHGENITQFDLIIIELIRKSIGGEGREGGF